MKNRVSINIVAAVTLLAAVCMLARSADGADRAIHADVPPTIDPAARYLFHMHGRAIEVAKS